MWILRSLPVSNETIVYGKNPCTFLVFLTTLPFLAVIPLFLGVADLFISALGSLGFFFPCCEVSIGTPLRGEIRR